jgi:hypothetical protein
VRRMRIDGLPAWVRDLVTMNHQLYGCVIMFLQKHNLSLLVHSGLFQVHDCHARRVSRGAGSMEGPWTPRHRGHNGRVRHPEISQTVG